MPNLDKLNPEQRSAVEHQNGPLLIVAGAGTGKTTVITQRLAYLIENKLAQPDEILVTTFTEKATAEMEERADKILPYGYVDLWINTFHSFCERILRDHGLDIGLRSDFKLLSQTEQWVMIRKNLDAFDLDYYRPLGNPTKFIHELLKHFSRLKDENIPAAEYLAYAEELEQNGDAMLGGASQKSKKTKKQENKDEDIDEMEVSRIKELANAYHVYNQMLLDGGYLDFGDLITYTLKLFTERPNILKAYRKKFKYIMVDEFQDTNWAQYELVKMLASPDNNLVVVGDDDQAVYRFRGASMSNIMQFKDDYPKAKEVVLTKNYRSGQEILDSAYRFIKNNDPNRLEVKLKIDKKLSSGRKDKATVEHWHFATEAEETAGVVGKIIELYKKEKETNWSDFAILIRANDTADKFIAELTRQGVPNQFMSARGLYFKPIILDTLAYLKMLDNYHESAALFRVLNMEVFKIGYADIVELNKFARKKVWSTFEALKNIQVIPGISPEAVANANQLLGLIAKHSQLAQKEKVSKVFVNFIYDSGALAHLDRDKDKEIFDYLNQFYKKIKSLEEADNKLRIKDFVDTMEMEMEAGDTGALQLNLEDADVVRVMTVHGAKGLEFKYVFVVNLVDKKFPTINRGEKISIPDALVKEKVPEGDTHIEEERRLFYVAMTRARDALFLTSAVDYGGARDKKPSKFLAETGLESGAVVGGQKSGTDNQLIDDLAALTETKETCEDKYVLPEKFSFSQIEAYSKCPLQYKYNFILKIPIEEKVNFIFGRLMHNVLKDFMANCLIEQSAQLDLFGGNIDKRKAKPTLEDLMEIFKRYWTEDGYRSKKEREEYKQKGKDSLAAFYSHLENEGWPEVLLIEKVFNVRIGGYTLRGAIDRVDKLPDGSVEIIDYKTGSPKDKLDFETKRQLLIYQIAVEELFGLRVSALSFYYLENGVKLSFTAKSDDITKVKTLVIDQINEIKKCQFPPKPNFLCSYCDFQRICEFGN